MEATALNEDYDQPVVLPGTSAGSRFVFILASSSANSKNDVFFLEQIIFTLPRMILSSFEPCYNENSRETEIGSI